MGLFRRIIGAFLIGAGVLAFLTRIPNQISPFIDEINPLVRFGITNPSVFVLGENKMQTLFYDILLIFAIIGIGFILVFAGRDKGNLKLKK